MSKTNTKQFFTVAGFSRIGGCIETCNYNGIFTSRKDAAKFVATEINKVIENENDKPTDAKLDLVSAKDCTKGYNLSSYTDQDDILTLDIVEHTI